MTIVSVKSVGQEYRPKIVGLTPALRPLKTLVAS